MISVINKARLHLALLLLRGLPENRWIGRIKGVYTCKVQWHAGYMDSRGILQGYELNKIFEKKRK
jgi:hypothetical protein